MIERQFEVDFGTRLGKIKPVGTVGGPLYRYDLSLDVSEVYRDLRIPVVRVAEVGQPYGYERIVDVHNLFPDFSLDERFPESFNFAPTDRYLTAIKETGAQIFLRLGESRDPYGMKKYINAPTDPDKYARILERIIAHYNTGWGGGYKLGIKYVELWTSPDRADGFVGGGDDYVRLYSHLANYLKEKHPRVKFGAYSSGGFFSLNHYGVADEVRGYVGFLEYFLSKISKGEYKAPLDFFTWELNIDAPETLELYTRYASSYLMQYGFRKTESIISRLSLEGDTPTLSRDYPSRLAATLCLGAKSDNSMLFYDSLDPDGKGNGIYSLDDRTTVHKYAAYEVMRAYGELYSLGSMSSTTDDFRREVYSLAASDGSTGALLLVTRDYSGLVTLTVKGGEFTSYSIVGVIGGGKRGEGHSNRQDDIPLIKNTIKLRVGKGEVYFLRFTRRQGENAPDNLS